MSDGSDDSKKLEDNKPEKPAPDRDVLTVREIRELEKAAKQGDLDAQRRLAEFQGVETYEQYKGLHEQVTLEIQAADAANRDLPKFSIDLYDPGSDRLAQLIGDIGENAITQSMRESFASLQDIGAVEDSQWMQGLGQEVADTLKAASLPWANDLQMQAEAALKLANFAMIADIQRDTVSAIQSMSLTMQDLADSVVSKNAALIGAESLLQLGEAVDQPLAQVQTSIAKSLAFIRPALELSTSVSRNIEMIKSSPVYSSGAALSGKDLLALGTAPEFHLEMPQRGLAYVGREQHIADELAENNRLQRELLAMLKEKQVKIEKRSTRQKAERRRMHLDTEASLQRLREIRAEAIANNRAIPKKAVAMDEAGITGKTWKAHDPELWARWEDRRYTSGK